MNSIYRIFSRKKSASSKEIAKSRLQLVLVHDRINLSPGKLENLKEELSEVISHYLQVDEDAIDIAVTNTHHQSQLTAQISVIGAAYQ
jgi:cell division topological specificity factor